MPRAVYHIPLSESTLRVRVRECTDPALKRKWKILLRAKQGKTQKAISEEVHATPAIVRRLIRRFYEEGETGLEDRRKNNRKPPKLNEEHRKALAEMLEKRQQTGDQISGPIVTSWLKVTFDIDHHPSHARRILKSLGYVSTRRPARKPLPPAISPRTEKHSRLPNDSPRAYPSDLTDDEWALLVPLLKTTTNRHDLRAICDAVFYRTRTGCQWEYLPNDFPPWKTVWYHYNKWIHNGVWQSVHDEMRVQLRLQLGREATPSAGSADSQSVKTAEKGGLADTMVARK